MGAAIDAGRGDPPAAPALLRLSPRLTDLAGGLQVRRLLPAAACRSVGPFVFFDHFGPVRLAPEVDSDVGPHPHIGLATVTLLFDGRQVHRDSLGTVQTILPGAVNWMSAGHGIVHSERTLPEDRGRERAAHGLQLWVALPPDQQGSAPSFQHVGADRIPALEPAPGVSARVLVGQAWGRQSPVHAASPTLYLDLRLAPGARLDLPPLAEQMAVYAPDGGDYQVDGEAAAPRQMLVLPATGACLVAGPEGAHLVLIGGAPLAQPARLWWNFVAADGDRERLAAAAQRWAADAFPPIPGESGRIPGPAWPG